jgi:RNA-directed DNA polymerase
MGWSNYFSLGPVSPAYHAIDEYTQHRLRRWLRAKHKVAIPENSDFPTSTFMIGLGLIRLYKRTATSRGRPPDVLSESRMR